MNKSLRVVFVVIAALVLLGGGYAAGRFVPLPGDSGPNPGLPTTPPVTGLPDSSSPGAGTPADLETTFAPFWEAWDVTHQAYFQQPVDDVALMNGAIRGILDALPDDYSSYFDAVETNDFEIHLTGEYDGIGAYVDVDGELLTIIQPLPGSPAEAAGLLPGDEIIAVDGEDVLGIEPALVRLRVLGEAGTSLVLTILRDGTDEPFDVTVTRAHIVVPSVEGKMLENGIAYINISVFGDTTGSEFHTILADLLAQNPTGIILDLRNNPGGYTTSATQLASEFIDGGIIWVEEFGDGTRSEIKALSGGLATTNDIPLMVLVNKWSASASELVSGAIQDYGRGTLVGEVTYGKGSVQTQVPISNGGTVHVTIARWLTPSGRSIHELGLTPDLAVELTVDDYKTGRDPQLEAAVNSLLNP